MSSKLKLSCHVCLCPPLRYMAQVCVRVQRPVHRIVFRITTAYMIEANEVPRPPRPALGPARNRKRDRSGTRDESRASPRRNARRDTDDGLTRDGGRSRAAPSEIGRVRGYYGKMSDGHYTITRTVVVSSLSALECAADRRQWPATRQAVATSGEAARKRSKAPQLDL